MDQAGGGAPGQPQPQTFAGIDADQVKDVVAAVWDHKDEVGSAVTFVREHGDDLLDLVSRLPQLLAAAANALGEAAGDTRSAAIFLTGGDGSPAAPAEGAGVKALAHLAGEALDACRRELGSARQMLDGLAAELEGVPIPSVVPSYSEIMGHKIITGLDLGDGKLLTPASQRLKDGAARFEGVGDQLAAVAEHLRSIGGLVDRAGEGLARTADKLESGGSALARFTDKA
jgi:hypothetical protein